MLYFGFAWALRLVNVLLFSGGYDSTVLKTFLEEEGVTPLKLFHANIFLNREWKNKGEYKLLKENYKIDFATDLYFDSNDEYIPARNSSLVLACANKLMVLDSDEEYDIYIAIIGSSGAYADCTQEWVDAINTFLKVEFKGKIRVIAPFEIYNKDAINQLGNTLGVDINKTFSCNFEDATGNPCGKCFNCTWRKYRDKYKVYAKRG